VLIFQKDKRLLVELTTGGKFYFRPLSAGELLSVMEFNDSIEDLKAARAKGPTAMLAAGMQLFNGVLKQIETPLVDWQIADGDGKAIEFNAANLRNLITFDEANELLQKMMGANMPTEAERGKSLPRSDSESSAAAPAAAGNA